MARQACPSPCLNAATMAPLSRQGPAPQTPAHVLVEPHSLCILEPQRGHAPQVLAMHQREAAALVAAPPTRAWGRGGGREAWGSCAPPAAHGTIAFALSSCRYSRASWPLASRYLLGQPPNPPTHPPAYRCVAAPTAHASWPARSSLPSCTCGRRWWRGQGCVAPDWTPLLAAADWTPLVAHREPPCPCQLQPRNLSPPHLPLTRKTQRPPSPAWRPPPVSDQRRRQRGRQLSKLSVWHACLLLLLARHPCPWHTPNGLHMQLQPPTSGRKGSRMTMSASMTRT